VVERTPKYLLVAGPYTWTRNPMYLAEMALWIGWALFYGSSGVLIGLLVLWAVMNFMVVPFEERDLEARFGDSYLRYKQRVPRWLGKARG
jgi:protein-S-isoprenylcysteine O-methyltransferase Ste14